jgi:DNA-binding NarL/FixJ family response regulator
LLQAEPDIEQVCAVATGDAAIAAVAACAPAVVVLDLLMQPFGTGTALLHQLGRPPGGPKVLALAAQDERWLAQAALAAGAAAFLPQSASLETLLATIRRLAGLEEASASAVEARRPHAAQSGTGAAERLSGARVRLLQYLAAGSSNRTIAHLEGVSERTVKRRISDVYLRLGASHRAGAVATAMQLGLI